MESDHLNLGATLFPKFGVGGRKGSLPPVLFHLIGQPLKTLWIPGDEGGWGDSNRYGMCNVKHYTGWENVIHFTDMDTSY